MNCARTLSTDLALSREEKRDVLERARELHLCDIRSHPVHPLRWPMRVLVATGLCAMAGGVLMLAIPHISAFGLLWTIGLALAVGVPGGILFKTIVSVRTVPEECVWRALRERGFECCSKCGYSLRGIDPWHGRCPECAFRSNLDLPRLDWPPDGDALPPRLAKGEVTLHT